MTKTEIKIGKMREIQHYPVLYREVLELLDIRKKKLVVDCTVGLGSHALKFLQTMPEGSYLVGIDKDEDALRIANDNLKSFEGKFTLVKGDFSNVDIILKNLKINQPDVLFFDLGVSMYQLQAEERGFSFVKEGPLDMRMDKNHFISAYDLVNNLSEFELENIIKKFGEERYARKIAHAITERRKIEPISTTTGLVRVITSAMPASSFKYKIHPATRTFQALRIAVNRELEALSKGLEKAIELLDISGRIGIISFHSLEDRIVKQRLKDAAINNHLGVITKKPVIASDIELGENVASRSAKLRVAQKHN